MPPARKRGRKPRGKTALNDAELREYKIEWMRAKRASEKPRIAVTDVESDPFDGDSEILPFAAEIWDGENSVVIWDECYESFIDKYFAALCALPATHKWIVYAHNGGKFDYMFLVHKLRGKVSFKGRGIMSAKIAEHVELRDSFHIIPDKLKSYKKDDIDYKKFTRAKRNKYRAEILAYLHTDCVYLYDLVTHFVEKHGPKLSIGQAAWSILRRNYGIESLGESSDAYLREYYFGGRVECPQGPGHFQGDYELRDVNSMYPDRMAFCEHPIGADYSVRSARGPCSISPNSRTVFLDVQCVNFGALIGRDEEGRLSANTSSGIFKTTIWEFEAALELNLIKNPRIVKCIDFFKRSNFSGYILPRYAERQSLKDRIDLGGNTDELEKDSLVLKLEMNNGYGKGAQNPRNFKEHYYTDCKGRPPGERVGINAYQDADGGIWRLELESEGEFLVWSKPNTTLRFNNVAMSASITGAARAKLLRKMATVSDLIYCDTDSVLCRRIGDAGTNNLGDWKSEKLITDALIGGRKLYAYRGPFKGGEVIRSKGGRDITWNEMNSIVKGNAIQKRNIAPHFAKNGFQSYVDRTFRLTCDPNYRSRIFQA